jgi:hypothetical protein
MQRTVKLLFWLMITGVLHMSEQLVFGVEELQLFKPLIADYYRAMAAIGPDRATVVLVTVVVTFFTWLCYAMLAGGRLRIAALGIFGLMGAGEAHHVIQSIVEGRYDPGLLTCVPYCWVGVLMLITLWREYRNLAASSGPARPAMQPS